MSNTFVGGEIFVDADAEHRYKAGSTFTNAFALGYPGVKGAPYLIAGWPDPEHPNEAIFSGEILDSEGNFLFQLERNRLTINPLDCKMLRSDRQTGYRIVDSAGKFVFGIETLFDNSQTAVTTVSAMLFGSNGETLARLGIPNRDQWSAAGQLPFLYGVHASGSIGMVSAMSPEMVDFATSVIADYGRLPS